VTACRLLPWQLAVMAARLAALSLPCAARPCQGLLPRSESSHLACSCARGADRADLVSADLEARRAQLGKRQWGTLAQDLSSALFGTCLGTCSLAVGTAHATPRQVIHLVVFWHARARLRWLMWFSTGWIWMSQVGAMWSPSS
jgi:hypothetical protein